MRGRKSNETGKPLLQGVVGPRSWVIIPPRIEESFLELWFSALSEDTERHTRMREFDGHWGYEEAVADLNRNSSLFSQYDYPILVQPHVQFQLFLWRELRACGSHLNRVVDINRTLRSVSKTLALTHTESERVAARARLGALTPVFKQLLQAGLRAAETEKTYWDEVFCVGLFAKDYATGWDIDIRKFPKMRKLSKSLHLPPLTQERNLDSVFQIRAGDLLREYATNPWGRRLSLLTISRLVLLVYVCSELAFDIDGHLTVWGSNPPRRLTLGRTYETLRNAGLR